MVNFTFTPISNTYKHILSNIHVTSQVHRSVESVLFNSFAVLEEGFTREEINIIEDSKVDKARLESRF